MKVGIPSEIFPGELRVAATPKTILFHKQGTNSGTNVPEVQS